MADRIRRIYSAESVSIPPQTQADVPVAVTCTNLHPVQRDWLVEPKAVNENLVVTRTLVSGDALTTLVRIINISDKECKINCDAELGTACEASTTLDIDPSTLSDEEHTVNLATSPRWMSICTEVDSSHVECMIEKLGPNLSEEQKEAVRKFVKDNVVFVRLGV